MAQRSGKKDLSGILPEEHVFSCHRRMMMHVDNIGGHIANVAGKQAAAQGFSWRFQGGEACNTRLLATADE